ncbi:hypothetical protein BUALT_Bualt08G0038000 [Buddleja alternifolia]|uniref:Uncharacterized protein n=1 Tax=Buddleja alternifolia TaxID=168488 RepID=A0AAV6XA17_9LAMI|nr:hypothetical protein BUALT_Bualt08G0038000 [Buddleja alternifolia]
MGLYPPQGPAQQHFASPVQQHALYAGSPNWAPVAPSSAAHSTRLLKPVKLQSSIDRDIMKILDNLYVEAIKNGGPSHGGEGHAETNALTLGGIKKSGPKPGTGN